MKLYTMGFTQKSARQFFEIIAARKIDMLVDIRLNNKSQLAGFTKGDDLCYFLDAICGCEYQHCEEYAPTKELLDDYRKKEIDWDAYARRFCTLMQDREAAQSFWGRFSRYKNVCLLCSEPTPEHCHRRLIAEMIANTNQCISVTHL